MLTTRRFVNQTRHHGKTTQMIEHLLITKLCPDGRVEVADLSAIKSQVMKGDDVLERGEPLEIDQQSGESILYVLREKISSRKLAAGIACRLYASPEEPAVNVFSSAWGVDGSLWNFPQLESLLRMYSITFPS